VSDVALLLLVVLLVLLVWRGPTMLPRLGASIGRGVREARHAADRGLLRDDEPADRREP
jgi:Sec-independent protein translocase protein TatA